MTINTTFAPESAVIETKFESVVEIVTSDVPKYDGTYIVTPLADEEKILETKNKLMENDVTVKKVPIYKVDNAHGQTVTIGVEVL